jgi:ribosome-binding factor A
MRHATSRRSERLGDQIMRLVAELLATEVADPRLSLVTVSGVRLNADTSIAEIFVTYSGDDKRHAEVEAGLERAKGFLRTRVGRELKLKKVPELRFRFDEFLEEMVYDHGRQG